MVVSTVVLVVASVLVAEPARDPSASTGAAIANTKATTITGRPHFAGTAASVGG
jgi:hypothetical protein